MWWWSDSPNDLLLYGDIWRYHLSTSTTVNEERPKSCPQMNSLYFSFIVCYSVSTKMWEWNGWQLKKYLILKDLAKGLWLIKTNVDIHRRQGSKAKKDNLNIKLCVFCMLQGQDFMSSNLTLQHYFLCLQIPTFMNSGEYSQMPSASLIWLLVIL